MKAENKEYSIKWRILKKAQAYRNGAKRCNLCLTEKLAIIDGEPNKLLNKRSELVSKCRHENKFYLSNYKTSYKDESLVPSARRCIARASIENNGNSIT